MMTICAPRPPCCPPVQIPIDQKICDQVLQQIGRPPNLIKIDAINVFGQLWRVNVWCHIQREVQDAGGMARGLVKRLIPDNTITHSFFIHVDDAGRILASYPPIPARS